MDLNDLLMYSAVIDSDYETPDGFRKNIILVVIEDPGKDTRDAMVALVKYRQDAKRCGIDADSLFRKMIAIASARHKYGWGTTSDLFFNQ